MQNQLSEYERYERLADFWIIADDASVHVD